MVQLLFTPRLPPVRLSKPLPSTAVAVPPQSLVSEPGVATNKLVGKLSLNATLVSAKVVLGLVTISVSVVVSLTAIAGAANDLLMVGFGSTVKVALAALPVPITKGVVVVLETAPEVLRKVPAVALTTSTEIVQLLLNGIEAPLSAMPLPPAAPPVIVPPQLFTTFGVGAFTKLILG